MSKSIELRHVQQPDLDIFFQHQQDPVAQQMAAFIQKDPSDRLAFDDQWKEIISNENVIIRTILFNDQVDGHLAKFMMFGDPE